MRKPLQIIFALALGLWSAWVPADPGGDPEQMVRDTTEQVLGVLQAEARKSTRDPKVAENLVTSKILPIIDFPTFAKLTLGPHWQSATPEQRMRFTREFQSMLIRTYAKYMLDYADTKVSFLPTRAEGKYTFVNSQLIPGQGKTPLQVRYRFKQFPGGWKAVDMEVAGLSMAKNFRTSFTDEVNQTGMDALIQRLTQANASSSTLPPSQAVPK